MTDVVVPSGKCNIDGWSLSDTSISDEEELLDLFIRDSQSDCLLVVSSMNNFLEDIEDINTPLESSMEPRIDSASDLALVYLPFYDF